MTDHYQPTAQQILVAARILDSEMRFHGHLVEYPTYEEMLITDPIGAEEYGDMIARMLYAAHQGGETK